jgi:hypothetical protein
MIPERHVYSEPEDVEHQLDRLGLRPEDLQETVRAAMSLAATATGIHPAGAPGFFWWTAQVVRLREVTFARKWKTYRMDNQEGVISPDEKTIIIPCRGDENTGIVDGKPTTSRPRGTTYRRAVEDNQLAFELGFVPSAAGLPESTDADDQETEPSRRVWLFLTYRDRAAREVRSELSLPDQMSDRPDRFPIRIILDPEPIDPDVEIGDDKDIDDDSGIEVPVARR